MVEKKNNLHIKLITIIIGYLSFLESLGQVNYTPKNLRTLPKNYKEDYSGAAYDYIEHISFLDKLKAWFIDLLSRWFNFGSGNAYNTYQTIKYILYFLIIGAVIYYLVKLIVNKEGRWLFGKNPEKQNDIDFDEVQHIKEEDFKSLISKAEIASDFRLAIKYQYLFLLKKMDIAEIISYDPQKTSHDYLLQLEGTPNYSGFNKSAYYYTYIWYGEFDIDAEGYKKAASSFVNLLNKFNND